MQDFFNTLQSGQEQNAMADWQSGYNAVSGLANMAQGAHQFNTGTAMNILPYVATTEQFRQEQPLQWTNAIGEVPNSTPAPVQAPKPAAPTNNHSNIANETKYLQQEKQKAQRENNPGLMAWVMQRAKELGIKI